MCVPLVIDVKYLGAIYVENSTKVFSFSESDLELLTVLANQAATAISNALLYEQLQVSFYETVRSLGNALEAKDKYTRGHSDRVSRYAVGIGKQLDLDQTTLHTLRFAAELHDIGKIAIKEAIIDKSGKLTDEEYETVKKHPELGVEILRPIRFLKPVLPIILHHHERYDGSGYPNGMRGNIIPLGARILNLADAFDAMTTQRPYNKPMSLSDALEMCRKEAGGSFDPDCVDALVRFLDGEEETMLLSAQVQIGADG
jgi:putative nucleotidyltransferase with HDIG domain